MGHILCDNFYWFVQEQELHNIETTRGKKRCSLHKYNGKQKYWRKIAHVATTQTDIFVATHKK